MPFRVAGTNVFSGAATTLAPVVPAGAKNGDLLVLVVSVATGVAQTWGGLSGWTQEKNLTANSPQTVIYRKFCNGDAGATVNPTWQTSAACVAGIIAYNGVDSVTPIDTSSSSSGTGTTTIQYGTAIIPLKSIILAIGVDLGGSNAPGIPTGYTGRQSSNSNVGLQFSDKDSLASSTGAVTSVAGGSVGWHGCLLSLRLVQSPTFRDLATGFFNPGTSKTLAVPASTQIGDITIASIHWTSNPGTVTLPSGWVQMLSPTAGSSGIYYGLYYKIATVAGAQSYNWSWVNNFSGDIVYLNFVGGTVDVTGTLSTTQTASEITTTSSDDLLVYISITVSATVTPPAGMTEITELGSILVQEVAVEQRGASGVTGSRVSTGGGGVYGSILFALKPPTGKPKARSARATHAASATSIVANVPPNIIDGDFLLALVSWNLSVSSIAPPAGWTEIESYSADTPNFKAYTRTASSEPGTYTWSWTNSSISAAIILALEGGGTLDVDGLIETDITSTVNFPSIVSLGAPRLLLFASTLFGANAQITPPVGSVEVVDFFDSNGSRNLAWEIQTVAAATGARTAASGSSDNVGYIIAISGNTLPGTPTNLSRQGVNTDTTPLFQADVSDPDSGQNVKARFEVWDSGHSTLLGTVDSSFVAGSGTVTAEYSSGLVVGTYEVRAKAIDTLGAESGYTSYVVFTVTTQIDDDTTFLWDIDELVVKDIVFLWNVLVSNSKDVIFLWNVFTAPSLVRDITFLWDTYPVWTNQPYEGSVPTWQEVTP